MGFEAKILSIVKDLTSSSAYFFNGTLCVEGISDDTALVILDNVKQAVTCDVKMTAITHKSPYIFIEYLYDFV